VAAPITTTQAASGGVSCSVIIRTGLLVRATPARTGASLGIILRNDTFTASGRTANTGWVSGTTAKGVQGWVLGNGLRCTKPIRQLAVINVQAVPAKLVPKPTPSK
jgi:hypothetical protein